MALIQKAINALESTDIEQIIADGFAEDENFELKQQLEFDPSGKVRDTSRNKLTREICAFANTTGGTLIVGIVESDDQPHRAVRLLPVPDCHDLAERLRRAIYESIEPKLPVLRARGIVMDDTTGDGVIVLQVPRSHRGPHRVEPLKECYRRVSTESRPMAMSQIQEHTLALYNESTLLERRFEELAETARRFSPGSGIGLTLRLVAVSLTPLRLDYQALRSAAEVVKPQLSFRWRDQRSVEWPWPRTSPQFRPILRGIQSIEDGGKLHKSFRLASQSGDVIATVSRFYDPMANTMEDPSQFPKFHVAWLLSALNEVLQIVASIRERSGEQDAEYGLQMEISVSGKVFVGIGEMNHEDPSAQVPSGTQVFPRYLLPPRSGFSSICDLAVKDFLQHAGHVTTRDWNISFEA